jgi:hypothetical protein
MDKETIQQIAAEVIARLPLGDRYFLAINVIVMALAAGFAAWFGSFLKTKGQNFATKRDFDDLLNQLRANTEMVEGIKSEVSQRDTLLARAHHERGRRPPLRACGREQKSGRARVGMDGLWGAARPDEHQRDPSRAGHRSY